MGLQRLVVNPELAKALTQLRMLSLQHLPTPLHLTQFRLGLAEAGLSLPQLTSLLSNRHITLANRLCLAVSLSQKALTLCLQGGIAALHGRQLSIQTLDFSTIVKQLAQFIFIGSQKIGLIRLKLLLQFGLTGRLSLDAKLR